jgi:GH25 family lysozyme M1 (1,4-beta-N-acetylmuramidase)
MAAALNKCTEGDYFLDEEWVPNCTGCTKTGLPHGGYHFFRPKIDPVRQAVWYLANAYPGVKVFCCDVETALLETVTAIQNASKITAGKTALQSKRGLAIWDDDTTARVAGLISMEIMANNANFRTSRATQAVSLPFLVEMFCDYVLSTVPNSKMLLYTSPYFWNTFMKYADGTYPDWNEKYFLWLAHYYVAEPLVPYPWKSYLIHQYTDKVSIPGIKTLTDGNWFLGDAVAVQEFFGNGGAPPAPVPYPESITILADPYINLRNTPSDASYTTVIGRINKGKTVYPQGLILDAKNRPWYELGTKLYVAGWKGLVKPN